MTCTVRSLAKAITGGLYDRRIIRGKEVDVGQREVAAALLQVHKNLRPRWPTDFDEQILLLQDRNYAHWRIKLRIQEKEADDYILDDIRRSNPKKRYLLAYTEDGGRHCVYVTHYNKQKRLFHCLNSHGDQNRHPKVPLKKRGNVLYRLSARQI